ncbi:MULTISPECIES: helix-turn-helix transcriptional regulator [unclassified Streptomyces]|uniref:Helix-turn-helix transcriptional regulator n=1 Tax=Streptomyces evansiae TaxID=3075535 RepID=A0ABU2QU96_9ACTN|nr:MULTISPECIES: helix-turn-helix transcriptional regulator [unclassified Streptomyces]EFK99477.1 DNA-binding protein [Streptomyces sp. SPB78]MDT0407920.1 helix-turn-helix transcriptional regulator [Streptomyces sp. DSM 41979]MYQ56478.1 helix-turn-helix domain-containing protein [Streptomyces sp. SID4926]MYR25018.1 helix-turn-helix domain-containing protein [Streptomyces sp. SID4945]SCD28652.1 Helix-turn-helix domain-containing protein [Streptomyces sp. TverLS-915]
MSLSPSSSAQAARERVAQRLHALRVEAGLTGGELAARCGWTHSKSSRIENARTPPSPDDIRRWCEACGAQRQVPDLVAESLNAESQYVEWRRRVRDGLRRLQGSYVELFRSTSLFRVYSPTLVPGLLQTEGYARALLSANARMLEIPDDANEAAPARTERSQIIHERGHRFVFLIEEAVLRYQLGDHDAMAAQLGHLLTAGALPAVSLGIIPAATANRALWPQEVFHMYDDSLVSIETLSARVTVTQPSEIALYLRAFEELRSMAVYGADARALVVRAIDALR